MKQLYKLPVLLLLLMAFSGFSQQDINTSFGAEMSQVFQNLEKQRVPYGLLKDYAFEFTELAAYNGVVTDTNYVTPMAYGQVYNTLLMARIHSRANNILVSPEVRQQRIGNHQEKGVIPLEGLHINYAQFRPDAVFSNKLRVQNNQFYDTYNNGVWQNPYQHKTTFAIAPTTRHHKGLEFEVLLPQELWFSNTTNTDETYLPLLKTVATSWLTKRQTENTQETTTLVLLGLSYNYAKLNENALANNRITVTNNRYYDKYINGVWQNPYEVSQALAITPPINTIKEKTFNILFPRALLYSNHDSTILSVQVNLGDGQGYKNLLFDQPLTVNYQSNGDYNWIFKVNYNTGGILESRYTKTKVRIAQEFTVKKWEDRYKPQN